MYVIVHAQDEQDLERAGAVRGVKRLDKIRNSRRGGISARSAGFVGIALAVVALVALAVSNQDGVGEDLEQSIFSGSMQKYNPTTGLLITKYADPGYYTRAWWGKDVKFQDLLGSWETTKGIIGDPKMTSYTTSINFPDGETISGLMGPPFPQEGESDFHTLICGWKGRFEIVKPGYYNFTIKTNANGAFLNISGETVLVNADGGEQVVTDQKFGAGFHRIDVLWKAPPYNQTNQEPSYISLEYSGPDTDDNSIPLNGVHFPFEMDPAIKKDAKNLVKKGFGVLEYKLKQPFLPFWDTSSGLPSLKDFRNKSLLNADLGARVRKLDMANHEEFVAKLKDRKFPTDDVVLLIKGIFKIETRGFYNFTLESDDGSQLFVDNKPVADTRLDTQGELPHNYSASGAIYLQHGWHLARVVWFENTTANDQNYESKKFPTGQDAKEAKSPERQRDSQVLRLLYAGPDTGGEDSVIKGYYLKGVPNAGSLRGIKMSDGEEEDEGDSGNERNWAAHFDQEWLSENKDKKWKVYDDKDRQEEIYGPAAKIVSPYTDYDEAANDHQHSEVPEDVYDHPAPYDHEVVDLGGKGIKWEHKEADGSYVYSVMGSPTDWSVSWDKTPNSVGDLSGR